MCYTCEPYYCKYVSTSEEDFLRHIGEHIQPGDNYACFRCEKQFGTREDLLDHIKNKHTTTEYECISCAEFFFSKARFNRHKCKKTIDLSEVYLSGSEQREIQYMMDYNIEH